MTLTIIVVFKAFRQHCIVAGDGEYGLTLVGDISRHGTSKMY